jgi:hypothetical protein
MIKLTKILEAITLKKNKWQPIPSSELKAFQKQIFDLIKTAYKPIGGHGGFKTPSDVDAEKFFTVIDIDSDPEPEAVVVTKKRGGGSKHIGLGHDGTSDAKRAVIQKKVKDLKTSGHYVEVSGKMLDILKSKGVPVVTDEDTVRKVLKGKDIEWHGDGSYSRHIGGLGTVRKVMMGKPKP